MHEANRKVLKLYGFKTFLFVWKRRQEAAKPQKAHTAESRDPESLKIIILATGDIPSEPCNAGTSVQAVSERKTTQNVGIIHILRCSFVDRSCLTDALPQIYWCLCIIIVFLWLGTQ